MEKRKSLWILRMCTILLVLVSLSGCMNYTGFAVFEDMNIEITEDQTYTITLDEESVVSSIKVSGEFEGDGIAFIYLDLGNEVKVILNSELLEYDNNSNSSIIEFNNICVNTCNLDLIGKEFSISFIVQDAILRINGFDVESEPFVEEIVEETLNDYLNETTQENETNLGNETPIVNETTNDGEDNISTNYNESNVNESVTENNISLVSNYTSNNVDETVEELAEPEDDLGNSSNSSALVEGALPQNISEPLPPPIPSNITVSGGNVSNEKTTYYRVMINSPVRWKKRIELVEETENIKVLIPEAAEDIVVTEIENGEEKRIDNNKLRVEEGTTNLVTGNVVRYIQGNAFTDFIKGFFSGGVTGYAIKDEAVEEEVVLDNEISLVIEELVEEIEIEYYLPGPTAVENIVDENKKEITISSDIHYENVLTYTDIKEVPLSAINLYWIKDGNKVKHTFEAYDTNDNGLMDYIEWVTPHLSNQTFEVELEILTVQSYPQVGGFWTIEFNTIGTADLEITGWDGTYFEEDIVHIALKCNGVELDADYDGDSVYYGDYECDGLGEHIVQVFTEGEHTQKFDFGGVVAYAHNFASIVPNTINLQGKLENSSGDVQTGTFNFTFVLYDAASGGNTEWTETQNDISVDADGIYDVILGSVTPINLAFDEQYYLGIDVDGDGEMSPRINLTSVPYTQRAKFADTLECADCIDTVEIINYTILPIDVNASGAADEDILTYESTGSVFEWHTPAELITAGDSLNWTGATLDVSDDWYDSVNDIPNATPANGVHNFSTADQIYDYIAGLGYGSGDITAVNTAEKYLTGGADTGAISLLLNETELNTTIEALDDDTTYTGGTGIGLSSEEFTVAGGTALTADAGGLSVTADAIDGTQLADTLTLDATLAVTQVDFDVNFDANTLFVDGTESRVGIGTITPGEKLEVDGNINVTTGNDICIEGGNCLSDSGSGDGDITAVNTAEKYLTGGADTGAVSLLLNETELNTTIEALDDDTIYTAGTGIGLSSEEFTVAGGTGLTTDAGGLSVTADAIGDTQLEYNTGQALTSTSEPTFATLDTGQGANELYGIAKDLVAGDGLTGGGDNTLYGADSDLTLTVVGGTCITANANDVAVTGNCIDGTQLADELTLDATLAVTQGNYNVNFDSNTLVVNGSAGRVGIGLINPVAKLHVEDGALLLNGTTGSTPVSGAGTRMMWVPDKGAFRAGSVGSNRWDAANIGDGSFAVGRSDLLGNGGPMASGLNSFAIGINTIASGPNSFAIGKGIQVDGSYSGGINLGSGSDGVISYNITNPNTMAIMGGEVGIGTVHPNSTLHVVGDLTVNGIGNFTRTVYAGNFSSRSPLRLQTSGTTRLYIEDSKGMVGIGTENPLAILNVMGSMRIENGAVMFNGTTGDTPVSGAGTRMMWIPDKKAFRVGEVANTEWDAANIGDGSIAIGSVYEDTGPKANGTRSIAFGSNIIVSGQDSFGIGLGLGGIAPEISNDTVMSIMGGEVGIGTVSPAEPLHVVADSGDDVIRLEENSGGDYFNLEINSAGDLNIFNDATIPKGLTILNANGRVGIWKISPSKTLDVNGAIMGTDYYSGDGTQGIDQNVKFDDKHGTYHNMTFKDGLLISYNNW